MAYNSSQFSNANGVTFGTQTGLSGNIVTASVAAVGGAQTGISGLSAGTTQMTSGTAVFSNSNNVSFGANGNTITASASFSQTTASSAFFGTGNTTYSSSGSLNGSSFVLRGDGLVSVGISNDSVLISGPASTLFQYTSNTSNITSNALNTSSPRFNISAGTTSNNMSAVTFSNSNGLAFGLNGSVITGSYTVPTVTNSSATISAGTTSGTLSNLVFSNSNGVSFGLNNGTITATVKTDYLTTARASTDAIGLNTAKTNVTWTVNSSGLSFDASGYAGTGTTFNGTNASASITLNSNGLRFDLSAAAGAGGGVVVANSQTTYTSGTVNLVEGGGAITIASTTGQSYKFSVPATSSLVGVGQITISTNGSTISISGATVGNPIFSAGTTSNNLGSIVFSNSNGVSFGLNGSTITASVNAGAGGAALKGSGTYTQNTGTVEFANSNGITFGLSNNGTMTASHNGITQQSTQPVALSGKNGSFNFSTATFGSSNGMHFYTTNGSMVGSYTVPTVTNSSFSVQDSATTINPVARIAFSTGNNITLSLSTGASSATVGIAHNLAGTSTGFAGNLISASMTHNSSGLNVSLNHPAWLTTAMQSNAVTLSNINISAGTTSTNASAFTFSNSNGITFGLDTGANAGRITASHNGLTTARASTDAVGLNTAQSNVTWTVNSSGLSFDARGYAGTATTFNGTNVSGSMTLNSAGLRLDLSAPTPGGGAAINVSAGTTSGNLQTIVFSNSNGVSFGLNGSTVTASAAGGAGGVAIAASNTTFTSGTVVMSASGGAITINSGAQSVGFSVPATSSLVGTNGISLSSNGSTISISGVSPYASRFIYPEANLLTGLSAFGNGSMSIQYVPFDGYVTATRLDALVSWSAGSSAAANTAGIAMTMFAGIYTRNASTLQSVSSATTQQTLTYASNTSNYTGINSAIRAISVPMNINMTPGEYYVGFGFSTSASSVGTATTNLAQTVSMYGYGGLQSALNYAEFNEATATSKNLYSGMGIYSAALSTVPPTISLSAINQTGTNISRANIALVFRNY